VPLVTERLAPNIAALRNSITNVLVESGNATGKLQSNACDELARMTDITTTTREEEAGPQSLSLKVFSGNSTSNCGFPSAG